MDTRVVLSNQDSTQVVGPMTFDEFRQRRVVVVVPAYNEDRFIGSVVLKILRYPVIVIVVDDGSIDDTASMAEVAGAQVVRHQQNMGYGSAITTGLKSAQLLDPDAVVVLDADGQHLPEELRKVVNPILAGEADIVLGSRYLEKTSHVPPHRFLGHWFFNQITRLGSGVKVSDSQSGYRAFSQKALEVMDFTSHGMIFASEIQFQAKEHNLKISEVPVTIRYLDPPKRSVLAHGLSVLNGVFHLIGQYRPLLFFGLPGLISMLMGIGMGGLVVDIFRRTLQLAVGYAMISVLLFIAGMVMFSTGIILHSVRGLLSDMLHRKV